MATSRFAPWATPRSSSAPAAMQVAHTGSPAQVERTVAILNEARRNVYAILAEDPSS
jgi:hypothetical protein